MNDHVTMAVVDTGNDLLEELTGFRFLKFSLLYDVVEELTAADELKGMEIVRKIAKKWKNSKKVQKMEILLFQGSNSSPPSRNWTFFLLFN